jgi:WD40 repeat protein
MKALRDRELLGGIAARRTAGLIVGRHLLQFLRPSRRLELRGSPRQRGPVLCLDIESSGRFLLTGALDCSVSLWDLERRDTDAARASAAATAALRAGRAPPPHPARRPLYWDSDDGWVQETSPVEPTTIVRRGRSSDGGLHPHTFAVSSVQWYPVSCVYTIRELHHFVVTMRRAIKPVTLVNACR